MDPPTNALRGDGAARAPPHAPPPRAALRGDGSEALAASSTARLRAPSSAAPTVSAAPSPSSKPSPSAAPFYLPAPSSSSDDAAHGSYAPTGSYTPTRSLEPTSTYAPTRSFTPTFSPTSDDVNTYRVRAARVRRGHVAAADITLESLLEGEGPIASTNA